jgi:bleomycin hydrolase
VENSYGSEVHAKGYLLMTSSWFREFVFEVVIDKRFCPQVPAQLLGRIAR